MSNGKYDTKFVEILNQLQNTITIFLNSVKNKTAEHYFLYRDLVDEKNEIHRLIHKIDEYMEGKL